MKVPPLIFSLIALGIASCTSYAPLPLPKHANFPPIGLSDLGQCLVAFERRYRDLRLEFPGMIPSLPSRHFLAPFYDPSGPSVEQSYHLSSCPISWGHFCRG